MVSAFSDSLISRDSTVSGFTQVAASSLAAQSYSIHHIFLSIPRPVTLVVPIVWLLWTLLLVTEGCMYPFQLGFSYLGGKHAV